jgi:micrococcal nuclease
MKLFAGFFLFFFFGFGATVCSAKTWTSVQVVQVIDGDTIQCRLGGRIETVRLLGVDTPELYTDLGQCARGFVTRELKGSRVKVFECGRDKYGRILALVSYKKPGQRTRSLSAVLLTRGLARVMEVQPLPKRLSEAFHRAEGFAQEHRLGLWRYLGVKP